MKYVALVLFTLLFCVSALAAPHFEDRILFPPQGKHVHGSSVAELPNGDLLACWFYGSGERTADDVVIQGVRLKKGASGWSPVFEMADMPGFPDCNPVLYVNDQGRLFLFWITVRAHKWEQSLLRVRYTDDMSGEGNTNWAWQDVILLEPGQEFETATKEAFDAIDPPEWLWGEYAKSYSQLIKESVKDPVKRNIGWMTRTLPVTLASGRMILPLYSDGYNFGLMALSDDHGKTWTPSKPLVSMGGIQPSLAVRKDGSIVAYLRDNGGPPKRVIESISTDDGYTWSAGTDTEHPNPGASLAVRSLSSGNWVMLSNDLESGRHRLTLALSEDEGKTWPHHRVVDETKPGEGRRDYPAILEGKGGVLHMTYTYGNGEEKSIKYAQCNEEWIKAGK